MDFVHARAELHRAQDSCLRRADELRGYKRQAPSLMLLAIAYWRACAAAALDDAQAQHNALLTMTHLATFPRFRALVEGKARSVWVDGDGA